MALPCVPAFLVPEAAAAPDARVGFLAGGTPQLHLPVVEGAPAVEGGIPRVPLLCPLLLVKVAVPLTLAPCFGFA